MFSHLKSTDNFTSYNFFSSLTHPHALLTLVATFIDTEVAPALHRTQFHSLHSSSSSSTSSLFLLSNNCVESKRGRSSFSPQSLNMRRRRRRRRWRYQSRTQQVVVFRGPFPFHHHRRCCCCRLPTTSFSSPRILLPILPLIPLSHFITCTTYEEETPPSGRRRSLFGGRRFKAHAAFTRVLGEESHTHTLHVGG